MIFLLFVFYALLLWPCAIFVSALFGGSSLLSSSMAALLIGMFCLIIGSWIVRTYQPELKVWVRSLTRLRGARALCILSSAVIAVLLFAGQPTPFNLILSVPACVALLLNGLGVEFWPSWLSPGELPETRPGLVEPPPEDRSALIVREYDWTYEETPYHLRLAIRRKVYDELRDEERITDPTAWPKVYVSDGIIGEVRDLSARLGRLGRPFGSYDEVSLALSFVQQIVTYTSESAEYPRYPLETLVEQKGDCEDFAILAAALLHAMGYQSALMYVPGHAALGVAGTAGLEGVYKEHDGVRYYYCEMTGEGWKIGQLPEKHSESELTVAPIPSPPLKVVRPEAHSEPAPAFA